MCAAITIGTGIRIVLLNVSIGFVASNSTVPASVVEVGMVVGHFGAVQPVDGGIGIRGFAIGIGTGTDRGGGTSNLETVGNRRMARLGTGLDKGVVGNIG